MSKSLKHRGGELEKVMRGVMRNIFSDAMNWKGMFPMKRKEKAEENAKP